MSEKTPSSKSGFVDRDGWQWKLILTVGNVADVKRETGVNLAIASQDMKWVELLFGDPAKLVSVLWVLCEEQAKANKLEPEAFAHVFDGATLEAAGNALAFAIADFFPRSRIASAIREGFETVLREAENRGIEAINRSLSTALNSPTNSPESAESIPTG